MQAIDHEGILSNVMLDEKRKIPSAHLESVCKIHQGEQTCRYIGLGVNGFVCVKHSPMHPVLDEKVEKKEIVACGNNCSGLVQPTLSPVDKESNG